MSLDNDNIVRRWNGDRPFEFVVFECDVEASRKRYCVVDDWRTWVVYCQRYFYSFARIADALISCVICRFS